MNPCARGDTMSLKNTLGMLGFKVSDEEIMEKLAQAHRLGKEYVEFICGSNVVKIHVHECDPARHFDASDRTWFAS